MAKTQPLFPLFGSVFNPQSVAPDASGNFPQIDETTPQNTWFQDKAAPLIQALGMALMSSPRNAPLSNLGNILPGIMQTQQKNMLDRDKLSAAQKIMQNAPPSPFDEMFGGDAGGGDTGAAGAAGAAGMAGPSMSAGGALGGGVASAGGPVDFTKARDLAMQAGFQGKAADVMAATALAESGGNPNAIGDKNIGGSYGLTQIHEPAHGPVAREALGNGLRAMQLAYNISKGGTDFTPWTMFKNGGYRKYMPAGSGSPDTVIPSAGMSAQRPTPVSFNSQAGNAGQAGNVADILSQYTPQELAAYKARNMIGPGGAPTVPPGFAQINSRGIPYSTAGAEMTPQQRENNAAAGASLTEATQDSGRGGDLWSSFRAPAGEYVPPTDPGQAAPTQLAQAQQQSAQAPQQAAPTQLAQAQPQTAPEVTLQDLERQPYISPRDAAQARRYMPSGQPPPDPRTVRGARTKEEAAGRSVQYWMRAMFAAGFLGDAGKGVIEAGKVATDIAKGFLTPTELQKNVERAFPGNKAAQEQAIRNSLKSPENTYREKLAEGAAELATLPQKERILTDSKKELEKFKSGLDASNAEAKDRREVDPNAYDGSGQQSSTSYGSGVTEPLKTKRGTVIPPVASATPIVGSQAYLKDRQTGKGGWSDTENELSKATDTATSDEQALKTIAKAYESFETGAFQGTFASLKAKAATFGVHIPDSIVGDPVQAEIATKLTFQRMIQSMRGLDSNPTGWQIKEMVGQWASTDSQPESNYVIVTNAIAALQQTKAFASDWQEAKRLGWRDPQDFRLKWNEMPENSREAFLARVQSEIKPFKGMPGNTAKPASAAGAPSAVPSKAPAAGGPATGQRVTEGTIIENNATKERFIRRGGQWQVLPK